MFKILLVDDNVLFLNKVRAMLDWQKYDCQIIGEAKNGQEALAKISQSKPDLMIIDISMPLMNGVELSSVIRDKYRDIKMIALSSYDDFEYVKNTMKNGVIDYFLKDSITPPELLKAVAAAKEQQKSDNLQEMRLNTYSIIEKQEFFEKAVLRDSIAHSDIAKQYGKYVFNIVSVQIINFIVFTHKYAKNQREKMIDNALSIIKTILLFNDDNITIYLEQGRFVLLLCYGDKSVNKINRSTKNYISQIQNMLLNVLNINIIWAVSDEFTGSANFRKYYLQSETILENKEIVSNSIPKQSFHFDINDEKNIIHALDNLDKKQLTKAITEVFERAKASNISTTEIQFLLSELLILGEKNIYRYENNAYSESASNLKSMESRVRSELNTTRSLEEYKEEMLKYYLYILEYASKQAFGLYSNKIREVIKFIHENYEKDISLQDAAEIAGFNKAYLSKIFKEKVGLAFVDYVTDVRINAAKKMIEEDRLKMKEVYEKVGFNNYNYFIKVYNEKIRK